MITDRLKIFKGINTLYPYIMQRLLVQVKNRCGAKPLYPYETGYTLDKETEAIVSQLAIKIPSELWGESALFSKNWPDIHHREARAVDIAAMIRSVIPQMPMESVEGHIDHLKGRGHTRLEESRLSTDDVDGLLAYLMDKPVYPAHVPYFTLQKPQSKEWVKSHGHAFGSYDLQTVLRAPHVARLLSDTKVISLLAGYFGCLPTVASINLFWSFTSADEKAKGPQRYHRDVDDYKTSTMFINLTDTDRNDGAHEYLEHTQSIRELARVFDDSKNDSYPSSLNHLGRRFKPEDFFGLPLNGYSFDELYKHFFKDQSVQLHGQRGQVLITDNYGIHRGIPPRSRDRLILWVSFALTATHTRSAAVKYQKRVAYKDVADAVEDNAVNRYVLRNVINFSQGT